MKKQRRDFIRKTTAMAALSLAGVNTCISEIAWDRKGCIAFNVGFARAMVFAVMSVG